ncbi:hypothetical protein MAR_026886, partial [Mya arenaria]
MNGVTVVKDGSSDAIMREFHSSAIGGHSGFNKTNSAIKVRYWWPRMTEDIRKYVKLCVQCQMSDPMKPAKKPDLQQIHVTAMYGDLLPDMEDAVHRVKESGDPETLLLTVLAKAYMEDLPPVDVLETLKSRPAFLSECPKPEGLTGSERLTVAGDGLEQQDLNTLEGNEWLNDKALNSYAKLLAREATDSSEPSAKRMFVIPSYTAVLWDAGMYDRYMYTKVDFTQFDFVVVPWNKNGNHWVVLVARPKDLTVAVYDSLGADNRPLIDRF